jgi:hypothetical protein
MTGTDEHCNSHSHSGTPTWGGTPVPQPMFQPAVGIDGGHKHLPTPIPNCMGTSHIPFSTLYLPLFTKFFLPFTATTSGCTLLFKQ